MTRFFYLILISLFAVSLTASAESTGAEKLKAMKASTMAHLQKMQQSNLLGNNGTYNAGQRRISDFSKKGEITDVPQYGTLMGDDGSVWFWTLAVTESETFEYGYGSAEINVYDSSNALVTSVTYNIPETMYVNAVEPFGNVSTKFYDYNTRTKEFTVYVHEIGPDYRQIGHFLVFNTDGELVNQYDEVDNIIWFDGSVGFNTYQRGIFVSSGTDAEGMPTTKMSVMAPASWNENEPTVEHVFELRDDLIEYSSGPCLNTYVIDGKPYYMLSYYEKPFVTGYDENWDLIFSEDNNYVVEIYDRDYNKVNSFKVPATHDEAIYCSTYACGLYSYDDLTRGYYTGDDKLNVVISRQDVLLDTSDDVYPFTFLVYDEDGNFVNAIAENVISWKQMTNIKGESAQVGCICLNDGIEDLEFVNVPSCQTETVFEAETEGRRLSGTYDRYPVGDSYQYVISMGEADGDAEGNVLPLIGWFRKDGSLDHFAQFNIGKYGEFFTPLIESYTLDPSLFNTDSTHEYVYIAKIRRSDGSNEIDNVLVVADEDGNEIQRFAGEGNSQLRLAYIVDTQLVKPRMVIGYYDEIEATYNLSFYNLPFVKFQAGGDGSEENPYVITSAGDMKQMATEPNAHYILGSNVDMSEIADPWTPIPSFTGTLDGKGFAVRNLYINSKESSIGLVGDVTGEGCSFKNIYFTNPTIVLNSGNSYAGVIAGTTMLTGIENVFVDGLKVSGNGNVEVGGLVGRATSYTNISSSYVKNSMIDAPNASGVGGIAAETRTATTVNACFVEGTIKARSAVGGVVGVTGKDSPVTNCHVSAEISGNRNVGGVVGEASRSEVVNNYVEGKIATTSEAEKVGLGGIAGLVESLWSGASTTIIKGNVVNAAIDAPENAGAVHRIAGFTIADEDYEEGETHQIEKGLADNYAHSDIAARGDRDATGVDGADVTTISKAFLETLGFAYGLDATTPWVDGDKPSLYIEENEAPSGIRDINMDSSNISSVTSNLYNLAGQRVDANAKGIIIRNGKKYLIK